MKRTLLGLVALGLGLTPLLAQPTPTLRVITHPKLPSREALDRLSLTLAWATKLPISGQRDGLASAQLLPTKGGPQLLVQTRAGAVVLLDGETGDVLWSVPVGTPFWDGQPAGFNDDSIFVTRRDVLYVLNRANGRQRVYTVNPATRQKDFGVRLQSAPSSPVTADPISMFVAMAGGRVTGYVLPIYEGPPPAPKSAPPPTEVAPKAEGDAPAEGQREAGPAEGKRDEKTDKLPAAPSPAPVPTYSAAAPAPPPSADGLPPVQAWSTVVGGAFVQAPPVAAGGQVTVVTTAGTLYSYKALERELRGELSLGATVSAWMGQYGMIAYVAAEDGGVYAVDMDGVGLAWRFLTGGLVRRTPAVTDNDVFVAADRVGLFRLGRVNGREAWDRPNRDAARFLAVNDRFVYALDGTGLLCVIDGLRGGTLATYDLRDWRVPVQNELTDRVYLANHDGQIICLRHRDLAAPLRNKAFEVKIELRDEIRKVPVKEPMKEPVKVDKIDEKKMEEKKAEPKKVEEKKVEEKKINEKKVEEKTDETKVQEKKLEKKVEEKKKDLKKVEEKKADDAKDKKTDDKKADDKKKDAKKDAEEKQGRLMPSQVPRWETAGAATPDPARSVRVALLDDRRRRSPS